MQDYQRERFAAWVTSMKGTRTGAEFADDVTATTGWSVERSRLSKYGKADSRVDIGATVIGHLSRYAEAKGFPPLNLESAEPPLSLEERAVLAAERQADLLKQLLEEMRLSRVAQETTGDAVSELAGMVGERLPLASTRGGTSSPVAAGNRQ